MHTFNRMFDEFIFFGRISKFLVLMRFSFYRAMKYFRECSSSRLVAVVGFFISFPVFLLSKLNCL